MNINTIKDKMNELIDKAYKAGYNDGTNFSEEAHACAADYKPDEDDFINCIRNPKEPERSCTNCDHLYRSDDAINIGDEVELEGHVGVVVRVRRYKGMDTYDVLCHNGNYWSGISFEINEMTTKKTGRHFNQVAELYEKMKED